MVREVDWGIEEWISDISLKVINSLRKEITMLETEIKCDTIRNTPSNNNISNFSNTYISSDSISSSKHLPELDVIFGQLVLSCSLGLVGPGS